MLPPAFRRYLNNPRIPSASTPRFSLFLLLKKPRPHWEAGSLPSGFSPYAFALPPSIGEPPRPASVTVTFFSTIRFWPVYRRMQALLEAGGVLPSVTRIRLTRLLSTSHTFSYMPFARRPSINSLFPLPFPWILQWISSFLTFVKASLPSSVVLVLPILHSFPHTIPRKRLL